MSKPRNNRVKKAKYRNLDGTEWKNNLLIRALPPPLSRGEFFNSSIVQVIPEEYPTIMETKLSIERAVRNFFCPLTRHYELYEIFLRALYSGYDNRFPVHSTYVKKLTTFKEWKKSVEVPFLDFRSASSVLGMRLTGVSGIGKTTAVDVVLSHFDQVLFHSRKDFTGYQVTYLKVNCPADGSIKQLCESFFIELEKILNISFASVLYRASINTLVANLGSVACQINLGVLIIDEIQHLKAAKSGGGTKMMNFLVTLANQIGIPICLIGTPKFLEVIDQELRQVRRSNGLGGLDWDLFERESEGWKTYVESLLSVTIPRLKTQFDDACFKMFHETTGGVPAFATRLHVALQKYFLEYENELLTPEVILKIASKVLKHEMKIIRKYRQSEVGDIPFEDLYPVGFYSERTIANTAPTGKSIAFKEGEQSSRTEKIYERLSKTGPETTFAQDEIEETLRTHPEWEDDEVIIYWLGRKGLLKKEKRAKPKKLKIIDFPEGVSKQYSKEKNMHDILQEKGFILDIFSSYPIS